MPGSTLPARALGRMLAQRREQAGLTKYAAAQIVDTSQQTVARIEDGLKAKVSQLWINTWADSYGLTSDERRVMLGLAQEIGSAQKSWWRAYADEMRVGFDHYVSLEDSARKLSVWKLAIVPGLLQTRGYRRAIAWAETPNAPTDQVEKRVEFAVRRQARLAEPKFHLDVILSEMVLRDQVGGVGVMGEQLHSLAEVGQRSNVSLRVVPFDATGHLGSLVGSFVLLEFPKLPATGMTEPPVVFVEEFAGDLYLEREAEVQRYRYAFAEVSRAALDLDRTRQLLLSIAKEYGP